MARSTPASTAALADDSFADLPGLTDKLRLDKWLWAARFFKTRSLAGEEIDKGRIEVNAQVAKASRELRAGDLLSIKQPGGPMRTVRVKAVSTIRGPAPQAQRMYEETPESISERLRWAEQRRQGVEPSDTLEQGRPTKRDRRQLADWQRWSASADDPT
jgi:ribosome-associated heat shock protein Hsp15